MLDTRKMLDRLFGRKPQEPPTNTWSETELREMAKKAPTPPVINRIVPTDTQRLLNKRMSARTEPLGYRVDEACKVAGIGRTSLYKLANEGKIRLVKVAGRTIVDGESLRAIFMAPEDNQPGNA